MSIVPVSARLLALFSSEYRFAGDLVTIGRQEIDVPPSFLHDLFPGSEVAANDEEFFAELGFQSVKALDHPDALESDIPHNLNSPLSAQFHGVADWVIEVGTLEHVFSPADFMPTIVQLLRPGGSVLHFSPFQGSPNHGFFNFQPTFFFSFYRANRFTSLECYVVEGSIAGGQEFIDLTPVSNLNNLNIEVGGKGAYLLFRATKSVAESPLCSRPMQEFYYRIYKERKRLGVDRLPENLYQEIVGATPDNSHSVMSASRMRIPVSPRGNV